jgi:hypothetical protein
MINQYFEKWLKIIEKIHFLFVPGYSSYRQISEAGKITFYFDFRSYHGQKNDLTSLRSNLTLLDTCKNKIQKISTMI